MENHGVLSPYYKSQNRFVGNNNRSVENSCVFNSHGGLLYPPPPYSFSYSIPQSGYSSVFRHYPQTSPPLLPLPVISTQNRAISSQRKPNRMRDQSLVPKKSNPSPNRGISKNGNSKSKSQSNPKGLDLDLDGSRVLPSQSSSSSSSSSLSGNSGFEEGDHGVNKISSSVVFTLSPPPSSLPLPTFSLRPKPRCNFKADAGIDTGAADNLRRPLKVPPKSNSNSNGRGK